MEQKSNHNQILSNILEKLKNEKINFRSLGYKLKMKLKSVRINKHHLVLLFCLSLGSDFKYLSRPMK